MPTLTHRFLRRSVYDERGPQARRKRSDWVRGKHAAMGDADTLM